jgi:hypothetical protein
MKFIRLVIYSLALFVLAFGKCGYSQSCGVPTAIDFLDINNVRATITNGQRVWQGADFNAGYEVPAGEGVSALYAGSLWIGGVSPDQQLKLAVGTFSGDGTDFFAGPLGDDAATNIDQCQQWDRIWKLYRIQSLKHQAYFDCLNDIDCDESQFGDYQIPEVFYDYPAHGDVSLGQAFYLAPFYDYNGDGVYNPENGDFPLFEGMSDFVGDCATCDLLKGDCCLFWIDNDKGGVHSGSQGEPIGIEIHSMAYAYASSDVLNNTTFYSRKIINRGTQTLSDTYVGHWTDVDLGGPNDDYIQCDIGRNLGFGFNGDAVDEQYGENPPVCGVKLMNGPMMDADGEDNDDDGMVDNETLGMTNFIYMNNSFDYNGNPTVALDYYRYMRSFWTNGQALFCTDMIPSPWIYGGDSYETEDPCYGSTENTEGNPPGDRRMLMSSGPFTLLPGATHCINHVVVWSDDPNATSNADQEAYFIASVDSVEAHAIACFNCIPPSAAFIQIPNGNGFDFMPASSNGTTYSWSFGDGSVSSLPCPTHIYDVSGNYQVCLVVTNECGQAANCEQIEVITSVEEDALVQFELQYSPKTNSITFAGGQSQAITIQVFDTMGKLVFSEQSNTYESIALPQVATGIFVVVVENAIGEHLINEKLVIAESK